MHGMKEIIEEAESLPIEEMVVVIDYLLRTINPPAAEIDFEWIEEFLAAIDYYEDREVGLGYDFSAEVFAAI